MCENLHEKFFFDMLLLYKFFSMPNESIIPTSDTWSQESFLKTSNSTDSANPYWDFFQETSDGSFSIGAKAQKSWLEIATWILGYIVPIAIVLVLLGSIHVFIRTQESNAFAENYDFICPYLNMGIDIVDKDCKTLTMIEKEYSDRAAKIKEEIITGLTEYIPIKISKNIIDASPEKAFIINTFENKVFVDEIMRQFERIRMNSIHADSGNIECSGISITNWDTMSTQCTIYGWKIGTDDSFNKLWSARIEALSFLDELANTSKSQFILLNPPSSLNVEILNAWEDAINPQFETRTTIQIQVRYVSFNKKS